MTKTLTIHKADEHSNTKYLPKYATKNSACFDIRANVEGRRIKGYDEHNVEYSYNVPHYVNSTNITIKPKHKMLVPTGFIFDIPEGYALLIYPRSGLSIKHGINLINNVGVIDSDYKKEVFITLYNSSDKEYTFEDGERLCQGRLVENIDTNIVFNEDEYEDSTDNERKGGFGSTGKT